MATKKMKRRSVERPHEQVSQRFKIMMLLDNPVLNREFKLMLRNTAIFSRIVWGWVAMAVAIAFLWPDSGVFSMEDQKFLKHYFRCLFKCDCLAIVNWACSAIHCSRLLVVE